MAKRRYLSIEEILAARPQARRPRLAFCATTEPRWRRWCAEFKAALIEAIGPVPGTRGHGGLRPRPGGL